MSKKELTIKQLKKQLTTLTENKTERSESALKKDLKNSFDALKRLDQVTTGQKIGDTTITKSMNKKIKNAKRYIEDLYDNITDGQIEEKEQKEGVEVTGRNEKSEGYGKMPVEVVGENTVRISQNKLNSIIEKVIIERKKQLSEQGTPKSEDRKERRIKVATNNKKLLDDMVYGAKQLTNFATSETNTSTYGSTDVIEIQTWINEAIDAYVEVSQVQRDEMGYNK